MEETISMPEYSRIVNYLEDHNFRWPPETDGKEVTVEIIWGDWKHDHLRCDYLMHQLGYKLDWEQETESNGSDCYSAIRCYVPKD